MGERRGAETARARGPGALRVVRLAFFYFGCVFAFGFALGVVRTLWLEPRLGERGAVLLELPGMALVSALAARWVTGGAPTLGGRRRWALGGIALGLMLVAEAGVVVGVRGDGWAEYVAGLDPVADGAYLVALRFFGAAPALVGRRRAVSSRP